MWEIVIHVLTYYTVIGLLDSRQQDAAAMLEDNFGKISTVTIIFDSLPCIQKP